MPPSFPAVNYSSVHASGEPATRRWDIAAENMVVAEAAADCFEDPPLLSCGVGCALPEEGMPGL